uniref:Uncharacterized protein n=1 Tax=Arundo donax TaxID=35708 RepID=A0A0A9CXP6_ARUDO
MAFNLEPSQPRSGQVASSRHYHGGGGGIQRRRKGSQHRRTRGKQRNLGTKLVQIDTWTNLLACGLQ